MLSKAAVCIKIVSSYCSVYSFRIRSKATFRIMYPKYPVLDMIQRIHPRCGSFGSIIHFSILVKKRYIRFRIKNPDLDFSKETHLKAWKYLTRDNSTFRESVAHFELVVLLSDSGPLLWFLSLWRSSKQNVLCWSVPRYRFCQHPLSRSSMLPS